MTPRHSLITFLGRTRPDPKSGRKGYRDALYQFCPRSEPVKSANFGVALANHLKGRLDEVVILGTDASDWSVLVENLAKGNDEEELRLRLDLLEAEQQGAVEQGMLDRVTRIIARGFRTRVAPRLIPAGESDGEQLKILEQIAASVKDGEVSIDVTHGLRYFGMIGLLSAQMLERIGQGVRDRDIWYGALDLTRQQRTPVLRLEGLTHTQRWIDALGRFDATGDYGVFADLLVCDGIPRNKARYLERAAFFERTLNLADAIKQLRKFRPVLDSPLAGASELFRTQLLARLRWCESPDLAVRQKQLAIEHLHRHDYLRAAIFGLEAHITCRLQAMGIREYPCHGDWKRARDELDACYEKRHREHEDTSYYVLRDIRNALAHSDPSIARRFESVLKDQNQLRKKMEWAISQIRT